MTMQAIIPHTAFNMHIIGLAKKYDLSNQSQMTPVSKLEAIDVTTMVTKLMMANSSA